MSAASPRVFMPQVGGSVSPHYQIQVKSLYFFFFFGGGGAQISTIFNFFFIRPLSALSTRRTEEQKNVPCLYANLILKTNSLLKEDFCTMLSAILNICIYNLYIYAWRIHPQHIGLFPPDIFLQLSRLKVGMTPL